MLCGASPRGGYFDLPHLVQCQSCRFVWTLHSRRPNEIAELYGSEYFYLASSYSGTYYERDSQWKREARRRLKWLNARFTPSSLLEVGCAAGHFLEVAERAGIDVEGIEISPEAAAVAQDKGLQVAVAAIEDVEPQGKYDVVCAFHVLEHLHDPSSFLYFARRSVGEAGRIAIEVPNIESVAALRLRAMWPGLQPEHHLWHFSPTTLSAFVRKHGYRVEFCETSFNHGFASLVDFGRRSVMKQILHAFRATGSFRSINAVGGDSIRLIASVDN